MKTPNLEAFLSFNFLHIYGVKPSEEMMTLVRRPREIPQSVDDVAVFKGGETVPWTLIG